MQFLHDSDLVGAVLNPECKPLAQSFFSEANDILDNAVGDETCERLVAAFIGFFFTGCVYRCFFFSRCCHVRLLTRGEVCAPKKWT